jgi:hypothetical protein
MYVSNLKALLFFIPSRHTNCLTDIFEVILAYFCRFLPNLLCTGYVIFVAVESIIYSRRDIGFAADKRQTK